MGEGRRKLRLILLLLVVWVSCCSQAFAGKVVLPLSLDHELLTSLLVRSGYFGEDLDALITGSKRDCVHIRVSHPQYSTDKSGMMLLDMQLFVRVGTPFQDQCFMPAEWQGYLQLLQKPVFDGSSFSLSFKTIDSRLYDLNRQPATLAEFLWNFAKPIVFEYLDRISFDLAPPVAELQQFLAPLFHHEIRKTMHNTLQSLKGGEAIVYSSGLVLELLAEIVEPEKGFKPRQQRRLTAREKREIIKLWETWDAFLVQLLTTMAVKPLNPDDQTVLLDVLLGIRHGFINTLQQDNFTKDYVSKQLVYAWQRLAPIFRKQLYSQPSDNILGYFAFFTAADALSVFDRMGPAFGLDISEQGLLQLTRMLKGKSLKLRYSPGQNEKLREMLQLPKMKQNRQPLPYGEGIPLPQEGPLGGLFDFISKPVFAGNSAYLPSFREILKWKVPRKNPGQYVHKVRSVLQVASEKVLSRKTIPKSLHPMFRKLIPAIAWQESCFRQFEIRKRKLTYLLSYNGSSVGLMQINERVWRGFYDRDRLRWDISYNALAGCEIVDLYLRRYVLKHQKWTKSSNRKLLPQVLYAMYNGGPGQYEKFQARAKKGKIYRSDQLFLEKYKWVLGGDWHRVDLCLVGG